MVRAVLRWKFENSSTSGEPMAPINGEMQNNRKRNVKGAQKKDAGGKPSACTKNKRKWVPERKVFDGSVQKGQGFAFKRRQKLQYEYKKLLRKESRNQDTKRQFKDEFPEHLKHLYQAEAEKMRHEEKLNRLKRRRNQPESWEEDSGNKTSAGSSVIACDDAPVTLGSASPAAICPAPAESSSVHNKKENGKRTSYQKTCEEYKKIQEKCARKKEEALRNKMEREEALRRYKEKKLETYKVLSKRTKKGQPNLNLQMEYLLQKIQGQTP